MLARLPDGRTTQGCSESIHHMYNCNCAPPPPPKDNRSAQFRPRGSTSPKFSSLCEVHALHCYRSPRHTQARLKKTNVDSCVKCELIQLLGGTGVPCSASSLLQRHTTHKVAFMPTRYYSVLPLRAHLRPVSTSWLLLASDTMLLPPTLLIL